MTRIGRALRTFTPTDRALTVVYGVEDADPVRGRPLAALLSLPFRAGNPSEPPSAARGFTTALGARHH